MITFTADQQMAMLEWLEHQREAGLDLEQVIQGLRDGVLTSPVNFAEQNQDVV